MTSGGPIVAELSIVMDAGTNFKQTFKGAPQYLTSFLGATRFAEEWLINEICRVHKLPMKPLANQGLCNGIQANSLEVTVTRDEAYMHYANAALKLKERLDAIKESDPDATFVIDPLLLEAL